MPRLITESDVEALAIGGTILGGGGGGWPDMGRKKGLLALELGKIELWSPEEAIPEWRVVTTAALGAPTKPGNTKPKHFIRAAQLLKEAKVDYHGVIAAENGGHNSFGGWVIAAALGLPIVDTPGDGRAHPTALMGSMGLHRRDYYSVKVGVTEGSEVICWGSLESTSNVIRAQARDMQALIAMVRDPVEVSYSKKYGAPGAINMAIKLGYDYISAFEEGVDSAINTVVNTLGGELVCKGVITKRSLEAKGGFDVGSLTLKSGSDLWELSYVNEYMTLEKEGERLATFPDLLTTFNVSGEPVTSASLEIEQEIYLVKVPKENILVGYGNRYSDVYKPIEAALKKSMIDYLGDYLIP